ncbi:hypothetical protein VNO77_10634 [Canavalia gladiata]|uniref:RWP-RK domain-containing protein n=1 Tax=Canavalia gladiata TaxID=3824 RepID=A0AAN9MG25_CANGL
MENTGFGLPFGTTYDNNTSLDPNFFDFSNPEIAEFSNNGLPQQQNNIIPFGLEQGNVPFASPMIQDHNQLVQNSNLPNEGGAGNFEVGGSSMHGQTHPLNGSFVPQNYNEVMSLKYWPEKPIPFFCSCCHVLRELIHTDGIHFDKLEIHGTLGMITHAVHHKQDISGDVPANNVQYEMIDLCLRSLEEVKTILLRYCAQQNSAGYIMVQDPLSSYYEALCTGMEWIEDLSDESDDLTNDMEQETENGTTPAQQEPGNGMAANNNKPSLSAQRERAAKMKLTDFSKYFHLPIEQASKHLGLCPTVVKKICRKEGVKRWPHRKVISFAKQMGVLKRALAISGDPMSRARAQAEINRLEAQMIHYCGGVPPTALDITKFAV